MVRRKTIKGVKEGRTLLVGTPGYAIHLQSGLSPGVVNTGLDAPTQKGPFRSYALGFESAHRFRMERTARRRSAEELPALKLLNRRMVRVFVTPECKKTSLFPLVWD